MGQKEELASVALALEELVSVALALEALASAELVLEELVSVALALEALASAELVLEEMGPKNPMGPCLRTHAPQLRKERKQQEQLSSSRPSCKI